MVGRPVVAIGSTMSKFGFRHEVQVGLLNQRHVLLPFATEEDYLQCWMRKVWFIQDFPDEALCCGLPPSSMQAEPPRCSFGSPSLAACRFTRSTRLPRFNQRNAEKPLKVDLRGRHVPPNAAKVRWSID
ncbi:hypothetical protein HPP92_024418 [Vanilla planifolia]|uniref:Uncharacterized protein n=1 Tax=Vanilla planifolia TaxID=51239 RepID=A0A835UD91_VANPL|nr:hypothetical protein HPP92_024418 [Vanilla planifolia]